MIKLNGLGKDFATGDAKLTILDDLNLHVEPKEFVAITGPSGSGKSTLLGLMAGLDRASRGELIIDGTDITTLAEDELSDLRGRTMGFVFQSFQLIQTLTALENVRLPAEIMGNFEAAADGEELLRRFGLGGRLDHYPNQLSGGEMQRVAIARASILKPKILFADEPTGNLDSHNGDIVMKLLLELNQESTLVLVTHNPELASLADREIRLKDGQIDKIVRHRKTKVTAGKKVAPSKKKKAVRKTAAKKKARKKAAKKTRAKAI